MITFIRGQIEYNIIRLWNLIEKYSFFKDIILKKGDKTISINLEEIDKLIKKHMVAYKTYLTKYNYKTKEYNDTINLFMDIQTIMIFDDEFNIYFRLFMKNKIDGMLENEFKYSGEYLTNEEYLNMKCFYDKTFKLITDDNYLTEKEIQKILKECE